MLAHRERWANCITDNSQSGQSSRSRLMLLRLKNFALATALITIRVASALAQPPVHYLHRADLLPPGEIGQRQLMRGGPLRGYFQPVEIKAPDKALVSLAVEGGFEEAATSSVLAGMQIGYVYRLRVANIPDHEGEEVYPS